MQHPTIEWSELMGTKWTATFSRRIDAVPRAEAFRCPRCRRSDAFVTSVPCPERGHARTVTSAARTLSFRVHVNGMHTITRRPADGPAPIGPFMQHTSNCPMPCPDNNNFARRAPLSSGHWKFRRWPTLFRFGAEEEPNGRRKVVFLWQFVSGFERAENDQRGRVCSSTFATFNSTFETGK